MPVWSEEKIYAIDGECSVVSVEQPHVDEVRFTISSADNKKTLSVFLSAAEAMAFFTHAMRVLKSPAKEIK